MHPPKQPQPQPSAPPHSQPQYTTYITAIQGAPPPVNCQPPQPIPGFPAPAPNIRWSSSLCSCATDDLRNCCLTFLCPCVTFGQIAEIVDQGKIPCLVFGGVYALICALTCCGCLCSCVYRTKIRGQYQLDEAPCNDCLLHLFCEQCALCQEYRELKHQGFDMSMGWKGNLQRQNNGVQLMPPMPSKRMNR